jgi:Ca2+-binding RTX toxin-like protein
MKSLVVVAAGLTAAFLEPSAHAQSAPTCSFDADAATLTVSVDGDPATLSVSSRAILLNGTPCGAATVDNTESVLVGGSGRSETIVLSGNYRPGLTVEADGTSEIEFNFTLGAGRDTIKINGTSRADTFLFTAGGINVGTDGDEDLTFSQAEVIRVDGKNGNDTIDASSYALGPVNLHGNDGDDLLVGTGLADTLYGNAGADVLHGGPANDILWGGLDDDLVFAEAGDDIIYTEPGLDGADEYYGGDGGDVLSYATRALPLTITMGNGLADDGESGELDLVGSDVEQVIGGSANDTLIGSAADDSIQGGDGDDVLRGGDGNDVLDTGAGSNQAYGQAGNDLLLGGLGPDYLHGGAGDDRLDGSWGDDTLVGADGADYLNGEEGNDTLRGNAGDDSLVGDAGEDLLYGGPDDDALYGGLDADYYSGDDGSDRIYNADGVAEQVFCGLGFDTFQTEPVDTFDSCEMVQQP